MNFCTNCGAQFKDDNQQFCGKCGAKLTQNAAVKGQNPWETKGFNPDATQDLSSYNQMQSTMPNGQYNQQYSQTQSTTPNEQYNQPYNPAQSTMQNQQYNRPYYQAHGTNPALPMKWYKFLIYFAFFAGAVINLCNGIAYISGSIYSVQSNGQTPAWMVYAVFNGLKTVDVIYGILSIVLAALCIYARFRLSNYRKDGPLFVYITYAANGVITLIYSIAAWSITEVNQLAGAITAVIAVAVAIVLNVIYFNKRKNLFIN